MKYIFWTNYLLLLNEKSLNFTIYRNTQLEGAISGPDRAPILQAQIWARSGRAFHYWSGARQINLSGPHFFRSAPHQYFCTGLSVWYQLIRIVRIEKNSPTFACLLDSTKWGWFWSTKLLIVCLFVLFHLVRIVRIEKYSPSCACLFDSTQWG